VDGIVLDFTDATVPHGVTTFVATTGQTVTINRSGPDSAGMIRGGVLCVDTPAGAGVYVPAEHVFRLTAGDFSINLEWPLGGVANASYFGNTALRHLMGDATTGILAAGALVTIRAWSGDPDDGGTELDSWTVNRNAAAWPVSSGTCYHAGSSGAAANPGPGDWTVDFLTVELAGVSGWAMKVGVALTVTSGNVVTVASGDMTITLT
jgi:hypothetical protein